MCNQRWLKAAILGAFVTCSVTPASGQQPAHSQHRPAERALDEDTSLEFVDTPLKDVLNFLTDQHAVKIELAAETQQGPKRIDPEMPLTFNVKQISLRSALRLLLNDYGLEVTVTPQESLLIVPGTPELRALRARRVESQWQQLSRERLLLNLKREKGRLEFKDTSLKDVMSFLADLSGCTIVFDRRSLAAAGVSPDQTISCTQPELPLAEMLKCALLPFDLRVIIQDEVLLVVQRDNGEKSKPSAEVAKALETKLDIDLNQPLPVIAAHLTEKTGIPFILHYPALKAAAINLERKLIAQNQYATPAQVMQGLRTPVPLMLLERDGIVLITVELRK